MRQGEILKLRWENINFRSRVAHLPETKNGSKRDVPLSLRARDALIRLGQKTEGEVFSYSAAGLKSVWRLMNISLGIKNLHFHDTRHEACSRLFELGTLDIMEVAAITGHKSLAMLKRYTHLSAAKLVKKLDGSRNRHQQTISDLMISYPAEVSYSDSAIVLNLLDFKNLSIKAESWEQAKFEASNALLRRIALLASRKMPIPQPDQYLANVDKSRITMIDPLPLLGNESELDSLDTLLT